MAMARSSPRVLALVACVVLVTLAEGRGAVRQDVDVAPASEPTATPAASGNETGDEDKDTGNTSKDSEATLGCALWEACYHRRCCGSGSCYKANGTHSALSCGLWESCYMGRCCGSGSCIR